jgi:glycosyltransferase involved in cell wall biosynthesis
MNVLLIDHAPFFGGAEAFLLDLLTELNRAEFTPTIVTDSHSPVLEKFRATGVPVATMNLPQINRTPFFLARLYDAGKNLARIARASRADVMHTFTARTHLIGAVASRLSGIPIVWRLGDDTLPAWTLNAFARVPRHIVIVGVSKWIASCYPGLRFDGLVPDGARPPLAISRQEARAELGLGRDELIAAHIGRLVRWKGQDVFIRAMAQVAKKIPNARGVIVGAWHREDERPGMLGGGESYANELRALAEQLGAPIAFAGFIRDPGLAYAAADVVTHTSTLPEPFGRITIEAMMASRPAVAANAGAQPEIVVPNETGLLTPLGDADVLANALVELFSSPLRREAMGRAGQLRAQEYFSLALMTERMQASYRLATQSKIQNRKTKIENANHS